MGCYLLINIYEEETKMMKQTRKPLLTVFIAILAIIMGAALFTACGEAEKPAEKAAAPAKMELEPIKLAVAGPHSGDLASYGIPTIKAAELVVEKRNAMNGVNGRKVELDCRGRCLQTGSRHQYRHKSGR